MTQQQSPWLEGKYGWNFGEGGWNTGMDQNLLKFSFMFDRNVDNIVASLPAAVDGQAHFLTTDNRLYFAVGTTYFSTPVPKWFEFKIRSTGDTYQFNGVSAVQVESPASLETRLDAVELTISSLGTSAFEDIEFFATQAELDVTEANAAAYTDALRQDVLLETNLVVNIPTDYLTLQAAIDDLSTLQCRQGVTITLMIESGHQPASGVSVARGDYSHFKIASVDAEVTVSAGYSGSFVQAKRADAPVLACLVDLDGLGGFGANIIDQSTLRVDIGAGLKNGPGRGLYINKVSTLWAEGAVVNGFQGQGLWCSRGSTAHIASANFDSNALNGELSTAAIYGSRGSTVYGDLVSAQNSGSEAVRVQRAAKIVLPDCNLSGGRRGLTATLGGEFNASVGPMIMLNVGERGINVSNGGRLSIPNAVISGAAGNSSVGVEVVAGSSADINAISIDGFGATSLRLNDASTVNARNAQITGGGAGGVIVEQVSNCNLRGATVQCAGTDLTILRGSTVFAGEVTTTAGVGTPAIADTNISAFNALQSNAGIIWV